MGQDSVLQPENAQRILNAFEGTEKLTLQTKCNTRYDGPDTMLHSYETEDGLFVHMLEIDYVSGLEHVNKIVSGALGHPPVFYKLKRPAKRFEDTAPYKHATVYKMPENVDDLLRYAYPGGISYDFYFTFAIKGAAEDTVRLA